MRKAEVLAVGGLTCSLVFLVGPCWVPAEDLLILTGLIMTLANFIALLMRDSKHE